jgi:hypothetical protein
MLVPKEQWAQLPNRALTMNQPWLPTLRLRTCCPLVVSRSAAPLHVRSPAICSLDPILWSGTLHQRNAAHAALSLLALLPLTFSIALQSTSQLSLFHPRTRNRVRPKPKRSARNVPTHLNEHRGSIDLDLSW